MPPRFLMVDPAHFEVAYAINPWMDPDAWRAGASGLRTAAQAGFDALRSALADAGAQTQVIPGAKGAPDLVFPANAAVVLDGLAVLARFRCKERQVEEPIFRAAFAAMVAEGDLGEVLELPEGVVQEGAGDFIWDAGRELFWAGYGPRSTLQGARAVAERLGSRTIELELATPDYYHLDTCFCPLPGGEILYYPPAFTPEALARIRRATPETQRIEATPEDARRFCVNAVAIGSRLVMATAAAPLRRRLTERGYEILEVDLSPFILSGGGAYCMTLRLDRSSGAEPALRRNRLAETV